MSNSLYEILRKHDIKPPVCFSDCGPGWYSIVETLIEDLVKLGWNRDLHQVKEKWGGLRFYVGSATDDIFERIIRAERDSYSTCENCGAPGTLRTRGWHKTQCDRCFSGKGEL